MGLSLLGGVPFAPFCCVQAALCCIRILRHLPEHVEDFLERITDVLKDRHHGVLVAGVQLITAVVESNPKVLGASRVLVHWVIGN